MRSKLRAERRLSLAITLALAMTQGGCGIAFVRGPDSDRPPAEPPRCTRSHYLLQLDALAGALSIIGFSLAGGVQGQRAGQRDEGARTILIGLGVAAAFTTSATIGYFKVKRCRRAHQRHADL